MYLALRLRAEGDLLKKVDCECWVLGCNGCLHSAMPPQSMRALRVGPAHVSPVLLGSKAVASLGAAVLCGAGFLCGSSSVTYVCSMGSGAACTHETGLFANASMVSCQRKCAVPEGMVAQPLDLSPGSCANGKRWRKDGCGFSYCSFLPQWYPPCMEAFLGCIYA